MRETVAIVRDLIRNGQVRYEGETVRIENFDLWYAPRQRDVPIYLAAVFEKGIDLAGELGDGVILTRSTLDTAATVRRQIADAARRAGRDASRFEITTLLPTAVGVTREAALSTLRPGVALYAGFFPRYNKLLAGHGFASEASAIAAAWARGDRQAAELAVSDAMIEATSIVGTPEQCRARIDAYRQSGVDEPILSPFARGPDASARFEAVIRACAPSGD
jgi:alkanesulfonate monooxygenase SsuD/methylene tetrahydromethanopterin reductase-like flavin-dependent oxidoreductase (luciferase family)